MTDQRILRNDVTCLGYFSRAADPSVDTAHPLLVYAELIFERNERAREAAQEIADRFLSKDRYT